MDYEEKEENRKEFYELFTLDIWRTLLANMNGTLGLIIIGYVLTKLLNYIAALNDPGLALAAIGFLTYMLLHSMNSLTQRMKVEYKPRVILSFEKEEESK